MSDVALGNKMRNNGVELRDAMYVAIIKARAGVTLEAGDFVYIQDGEAWLTNRPNALGIVDPFLEKRVERGEYFLVVLMPGSVTNLRHQWSHPLLPEGSERDEDFYPNGDDDSDSCRGC